MAKTSGGQFVVLDIQLVQKDMPTQSLSMLRHICSQMANYIACRANKRWSPTKRAARSANNNIARTSSFGGCNQPDGWEPQQTSSSIAALGHASSPTSTFIALKGLTTYHRIGRIRLSRAITKIALLTLRAINFCRLRQTSKHHDRDVELCSCDLAEFVSIVNGFGQTAKW